MTMARSRLDVPPGRVRWSAAKRWITSALTSGIACGAIRALAGRRVRFHGVDIALSDAVPLKTYGLLYWGLYESAEYRFVRDFISYSLPVIEIGAGIGAISSTIARILVPGQRLICVEANPALTPLLRQNLALHAQHLTTEIIQAAIDSRDGKAPFTADADNLTSSLSRQPQRNDLEVPTFSLGSIASNHGLESGYQLVADIEGAESSFILDGGESLHHCHRMVIELHDTQVLGRQVSADMLADTVRSHGFTTRARYGNVFAFERGTPE
jgi:FkbM family methyltransferase